MRTTPGNAHKAGGRDTTIGQNWSIMGKISWPPAADDAKPSDGTEEGYYSQKTSQFPLGIFPLCMLLLYLKFSPALYLCNLVSSSNKM